MKTSKIFLSLLALTFFASTFSCHEAEARRHRKFKGVIIVNQILKLEGTMTVNGNPASEFSGVKEGDVLETADKSFAVFRVAGLGVFRLGAKTKFTLTRFNNRDHSRFELTNGNVLCAFRRLGDHEVKFPNGSISFAGVTTFYASTEDENTVCLCDGRATLKSNSTTQSVISAAPTASPSESPNGVAVSPAPPKQLDLTATSSMAHKKFRFNNEGVTAVSEGKPEGHSGAMIQDLESLYALP